MCARLQVLVLLRLAAVVESVDESGLSLYLYSVVLIWLAAARRQSTLPTVHD